MIIISILDILNKYTDAEHRMSQKEIQKKLEDEYMTKVDRKAVKRNIMDLIDFGFQIDYREKPRVILNKATGEYENNNILTDFYIKHDFENSELKMLIDSIVFSNHVPQGFQTKLIKKLENLSTVYFKNSTKNLEVMNSVTAQNVQWFMIIEDINDAINNNQKVRFTYNKYNREKKLQPECEILVEPYKIVAANNHYYLVCKEEPYDGFNHYRIDKITDLNILEDKFAPIKPVNLKEYLAEHTYMSSGKAQRIKMTIDTEIIDNVIDYFGDEFKIVNSDPEFLEIELKSNLYDMYYWALQFGDHVQINEPQELRDKIRDTVEAMQKKYYRTNEDRFQKAIHDSKKSGILDLTRIDLRAKTFDTKSLNIKEIILRYNSITNFSFLNEFSDLTSIQICNAVDSFEFLKNNKALTQLMLKKTGFNDLAIIKDLPIKELCLLEDTVDNMEEIYNMNFLKELRITRSLAESIDLKYLRRVNPGITILLFRGEIDIIA